jgi:cytochrome c553
MSRIQRGSGLATIVVCCACVPAFAADPPGGKLQYNRDVRPILADNCFACHGPDSAARQADLRLDKREIAVEMAAITPGDPESSEAIRRIFSEDPDERMPPAESHKTLKPEQKELLKRWIAEGAEYEPHWSLIAPRRPDPPAVRNAAWVRNPIDAFVLAKLRAVGVEPAPEADRRTLARRVCLDLTGLPPTPSQVDAFVNDADPSAYENYVDTLLKSPKWGEHRGRYWLDYARYADTHGIHFDNFREMWSYRDWVIDAFNRNLPWDRFTVESLAGDLLPGATLDQQIGSGFNRCNMTTNEGGIIDEEYLVLYARERVEATSQVWLGLTAGCAVCHDHKFDPISQREFYELAAFFNNTTQGARDGNIKDTPPIVTVPLEEDEPRLAALAGEIPQTKQRVEERKQAARPEFDAWLSAASPEALAAAIPTDALHFHAALNEGQGPVAHVAVSGTPRDVPLTDKVTWQPGVSSGHAATVQGAACELADVGDFDKDQAFTCAAWVKLAANDSQGAIAARMDNGNGYRGWDFWVQRRQVGTHIINRWQDDALKVVGKAQIKANEWTHVAVSYDGSGKAAGVRVYYNGKSQETNVEADALQSTIRTDVPFKIGQRHTSEPLGGAGIEDLRVYTRTLTPAEVESLAKSSRFAGILAKAAEQRTDAEKNEVYPWWLGTFDPAYQALSADLAKLEQEQATIKARGTIAHVMSEKNEAAMAYVLFRGEYDKRRDQVNADTPDALPAFPEGQPRNRLGFAQWLLSPEHPLTARVTVNRYWQEVFGTGLVRTSGDFGVMGELPSHPELLDWLAVEFRETGWDVKRLFKLIVMSNTYRQSAATTPGKLEKDPQNRLLSRGPRFRMDAEMLRDYALAASGLLSAKIGGPSAKPYQPDGVWEAIAMNVSNTRSYQRDSGEGLYRRSMYTFWKRQAPPASMDILNAPNREFCVVRRERTNTPLQALVTLNDPQFVEAARRLAETALKEGGASIEARIDVIARRVLCRPLRAEEAAVVKASLAELGAYYAEHPQDAEQLVAVGESKRDAGLNASELAAWTMLVNEVMNLDEVLNK